MKSQNNENRVQQLNQCNRNHIILQALCASLLFVNSDSLEAAPPQEPMIIEELLHLDTQAALLAARKKIVSSLEHPGKTEVVANDNLLLAIYGVGQSLTAELLLDMEPYVFKNRKSTPVSGRSTQYTLEKIQPPCVYLKKLDKPEVLCLGQLRP